MRVLGIDLGTTNTVAAMQGFALPISVEDQRTTVPSVVSFLPNETIQVGLAAKRRRSIDPSNTIFSAKRIIGRSWNDPMTQEYRERYPFDLVEVEPDVPAFETRAGLFTPGEIASVLLSSIFGQARHVPSGFDAATLTVPAGFTQRHRDATLAAAEKAGLPAVELINEPLAAAYAYQKAANRVDRAGVYDLGGGTFDFSIVDWTGEKPRLLAALSDLSLGGDDVDQLVAEWVAQEVLAQHNWDLGNNTEIWGKLVAECERAKIRLSFFDQTIVDLSQVDPTGPGASEGLEMSRDLLDDISERIVRSSFVTCDHVLAKAGLRPNELDAVFLAGGSTYLSKVREGVESYFGMAGRFEIEPAEVIALGASAVDRSV